MNARPEEPAALSDVLNTLAGKLKKVDLRVIDQARTLWPTVVDTVLAERCRVELIKDGVLIISVPSGAFAQQIISKSSSILEAFSVLGSSAPTSIKTVVT